MSVQSFRTQLVFDGQSLNNVPGDGTGGYTDPFFAMPQQVVALLGTQVSLEVVAVNGTSWTDLATTQATRSSSFVRDRASAIDILILQGGQSDVTAGDLAVVIRDDMMNYAYAGREAGFNYVIGTTIPPFNPFGVVLPGAMETARSLANELLLYYSADAFDVMVDLDRDPIDNPDDGVHYIGGADETHWTPTGAAAAARLIAPAIEPFVAA